MFQACQGYIVRKQNKQTKNPENMLVLGQYLGKVMTLEFCHLVFIYSNSRSSWNPNGYSLKQATYPNRKDEWDLLYPFLISEVQSPGCSTWGTKGKFSSLRKCPKVFKGLTD